MSTKLKCLLLDDELPGLTYLKMLCEQIEGIEVIRAFNSPAHFLAESAQISFDLCILDIEMPGINGLEVARQLNGKAVIFTTAYKEYAADAFDLDAVDYVRKPIRKDRLEQAIGKAQSWLSERRKAPPALQTFQFNTDKGKAILHFEQVRYIKTSEIDSRDKVVWLTDGSWLTLKNVSFEQLRKLLPPGGFARINKQEILAVKFVLAYSADQVTTNLTTAEGKPVQLALSEVYKEEFIIRLGGLV